MELLGPKFEVPSSGGYLHLALYWDQRERKLVAQVLNIKQCHGCNLMMNAGRSDQLYHSNSCQVNAFNKRKRLYQKQNPLTNQRRSS